MTRQDNGTAPPRPGSPQQSQRHSATQTRLSPAITTAQRHKASPRRPPSRPILRAQRIGHKTNVRGRSRSFAVVRGRSRPQSRNRNEHGPAPRPPRQKQEPFATHSGKKRRKKKKKNAPEKSRPFTQSKPPRYQDQLRAQASTGAGSVDAMPDVLPSAAWESGT